MGEQPELVEEAACDDARATGKGSYSGWLKKAKSENARFKMLQSSNTRYFTIDFDAHLLYYSSSSSAQKKISQPIPFWDILGAERLPLPAKKKTKGQCGFSVKTRDRTFELFANTPADAVHWTYGLNAASEIGKASRSREAVPDFPQEAKPTHVRSEERCQPSDAEMLPNSVEPADEDSEAADENEDEDEGKHQKQRAEQSKKTDQELEAMPTALEEEERSQQAEAEAAAPAAPAAPAAQEAIEMERRAKEVAEQRLQELEIMLKATEAEEADRKARKEAGLHREQEGQEQEQRLREEELQRAAQEEIDRKRQAAEEQQKISPRWEDDRAGSDELSEQDGCMDAAEDCKAETETVATALPSELSQLSRETELASPKAQLDLLKSDVRDLMSEGLGFLEEALDFVLSMQMSRGDDEAGAEDWMKLLAQEVEEKPSFDEAVKSNSKSKKADKKTERTAEEREARKARKEEKRKLREEQTTKDEQNTVEEDQRSAEVTKETVHAFQKKGLPALQPLKPLKKLASLSTCAPSSEAGSVPVSTRSSVFESAVLQPSSLAAKAAVALSGWDSDEASSQKPQAEVPEGPVTYASAQAAGPVTYASAQDAVPSGWDSDEEKKIVHRRTVNGRDPGHARKQQEPCGFKVPEGPAQSGQEPSGWDDSDSEKSGIEDVRTEMGDSSSKGAV